MTDKIKAPSHLKPEAAKVYKATAALLQQHDGWDDAQSELLCGYSNLVVRIRELEADEQPEEPNRRATTLATLYGRLESMTRNLALDVRSRREAAKPKLGHGGARRGRAFDQLKKGPVVIDPDSKWRKLGVV